MDVKYFAFGCSFVIFIFVVEQIRRGKLSLEYALTWLGISLVVLVLSVNESLLGWVSNRLGFSLLSNFIFFLVSISVIFLSLLLTLYANEQNKRSETLAQSVAILEYKFKRLENELPDQQK